MHSRFRVLSVVSALVISLVAGATAFGQDKKAAPKNDKALQAEIAAAVKIVDDALKGQAAPSDYRFSFTSHSMKSRDAKTYVPFLLSFDKGQSAPDAGRLLCPRRQQGEPGEGAEGDRAITRPPCRRPRWPPSSSRTTPNSPRRK